MVNHEKSPTVNKFKGKSNILIRGISIKFAPIKASDAINNPLSPSVIDKEGRIIVEGRVITIEELLWSVD